MVNPGIAAGVFVPDLHERRDQHDRTGKGRENGGKVRLQSRSAIYGPSLPVGSRSGKSHGNLHGKISAGEIQTGLFCLCKLPLPYQ